MQKEKDIKKLLGPWNDPKAIEKFKGSKTHKFLDRDRTLKINWNRLHTKIPEVLLTEERLKILDVASGNGATMEIFRYYGHKCWGLDYSPEKEFEEDDWLYKPLIKSQKLRCKVHDCSILPYPFDDKEFDYLICYGAITFFKPISNWPQILDEFARLSKNGFLVGVNLGRSFEEGEKYLDKWEHPDFNLEWKRGSIYKWTKK